MEGLLDPSDEDEVSKYRKTIPQVRLSANSLTLITAETQIKVPMECVSPPDSSGDEGAVEKKRTKRLSILQKARDIKKKKKEDPGNQKANVCSSEKLITLNYHIMIIGNHISIK